MSLSERHRWCMNKILEAFAPQLNIETVQGFMRNENILSKFTLFFKGDASGRMFVFYQPELGDGEVI